MGKRIVENLEMGMSWTSYIASVYGCSREPGGGRMSCTS